MAVKCSSSGGNSAMKARLVLMLLFGTVGAAHAAQGVEVQNLLCKDIVVDGRTILAGTTVKVSINVSLLLSVTDKLGKVVSAVYMVPDDVTKIKVKAQAGDLPMVEVGFVTGLPGLLDTLIGTVLSVLEAALGFF